MVLFEAWSSDFKDEDSVESHQKVKQIALVIHPLGFQGDSSGEGSAAKEEDGRDGV